MGTTIAFNTWLLQPGNHRQLRFLCDKLSQVLKRKVKIRSWTDLYCVFEESVNKNERARALFSGVFAVYPPSEENGATRDQVLLYRGAKARSSIADVEKHTMEVMYRGEKLEKVIETPVAKKQELSDGKPMRYYRGAPIK